MIPFVENSITFSDTPLTHSGPPDVLNMESSFRSILLRAEEERKYGGFSLSLVSETEDEERWFGVRPLRNSSSVSFY